MITQADLVERFGEAEIAALSDHDAHQSINAAVVDKAIADAVAEVNSYLAPVGLVGITPPKALVLKACDIARYYLHEDGATEIVRERYKQAIAWLKEVMKNPSMLTGMGDTTPEKPVSAIAVRPNVLPKRPWADD